MLLLMPQKEDEVTQEPRQLNLFKTRTASWIVRVWETIDGEHRERVVTILAEMAIEMTEPRTPKEHDHAPR